MKALDALQPEIGAALDIIWGALLLSELFLTFIDLRDDYCLSPCTAFDPANYAEGPPAFQGLPLLLGRTTNYT